MREPRLKPLQTANRRTLIEFYQPCSLFFMLLLCGASNAQMSISTNAIVKIQENTFVAGSGTLVDAAAVGSNSLIYIAGGTVIYNREVLVEVTTPQVKLKANTHEGTGGGYKTDNRTVASNLTENEEAKVSDSKTISKTNKPADSILLFNQFQGKLIIVKNQNDLKKVGFNAIITGIISSFSFAAKEILHKNQDKSYISYYSALLVRPPPYSFL